METANNENTSSELPKENDDEPFDLDEILPEIGEFGKYQKLLLFGICLPACIPCGFCAFNQLFMTDTPDDYWCRIPALANLTVDERKELAIPKIQVDSTTVYSKCSRYVVDWNKILESTDMKLTNLTEKTNSWSTEECYDGWEYNKTEVTSSIVIDFDLVCKKDIYPTLGLVALNVGGPIGVYLFGTLNDRAGRKLSYFCCLSTLLAGSFITAISKDFWTWAFSRVIVGLTIPAVYQIPFIIALELVGPNYRSFVTVMTCTFYTIGLLMLSVVTYLERDWIRLSLYTSVPFLLYFLYYLIMPESPRWLLMQGELEKALGILETMARVNGKKLPQAFTEKLEARMIAQKFIEKKPRQHIGALDLCKTPNMRLKTILITLNWFTNETVYLGLSYYGPSLGSNQYVSFFLSSAVEIPSYICCWLVMDRFGRRWPLCLLMIFGGISCIITVLLPNEAVLQTLILFLVSKSMISASYLIIYPFAGEIYPTEARGVGIGTSSYIGGLGLIVIPFITYLGKDNLRLPLVIMGCVSVLGGFTGLRLPETLHQRLPQTLAEGELFGQEWTFQDCIHCAPMKSGTSAPSSYENLDFYTPNIPQNSDDSNAENLLNTPLSETTPLGNIGRRHSMRRLVRQASVMDTQKTSDGAIQLTYWF